MEKKTKKTIGIIGSILLGLSLTSNVVLGVISANPKGLSGSVNEAWKMTETEIYSYRLDTTHYYSMNGDYIYNLYFSYVDDDALYVAYDTEFSTFDDLDVYFVFENYYHQTVKSGIVRTHIPTGGDCVEMKLKSLSDFNLKEIHVKEVWVRTIN